jgi:hypothetical protein
MGRSYRGKSFHDAYNLHIKVSEVTVYSCRIEPTGDKLNNLRYVCQPTDSMASQHYSLHVESVNRSAFELDLLESATHRNLAKKEESYENDQ